ncbi:MAG: tetratricopeptide repeat protein [Nitrospira sp.]
MSLWNLFRRCVKPTDEGSSSVARNQVARSDVPAATQRTEKELEEARTHEIMLMAAKRAGMSRERLNDLIRKYGNGDQEIPEQDPAQTTWDADTIRELIMDGKFEMALEAAEALIRSPSNSAEAHALKINALMNLERDEDAVRFGAESLATWPTSVDVNCVLGLANNKLRRLERAQEHFESVLRQDPRHARALVGLGDCYIFKQDFEGAMPLYDRAIAVAPNDGMAWVNRGLALANLENFKEALASVDRGIALWPDHPTAGQLRAKLLLRLAVGE